MDLPDIDFVSLAAGYGMAGGRVTTQDQFAKSLAAAISSRTPSLIEVEVLPSNSGMFEK
jgi:thiamine pyrophosphate-dependent acetolactate synthase large subunit-like protein